MRLLRLRMPLRRPAQSLPLMRPVLHDPHAWAFGLEVFVLAGVVRDGPQPPTVASPVHGAIVAVAVRYHPSRLLGVSDAIESVLSVWIRLICTREPNPQTFERIASRGI
jgi:hypothetical protein